MTASHDSMNRIAAKPADGSAREQRADDVEARHRLVKAFLQEHRYDALLLQSAANFAWFTSGADNTRGTTGEPAAALFITPEARVVVTNNIDAVQMFETDLAGLGFQLKQRAWHESRRKLVEDICRGRTVAGDGTWSTARDVSAHLLGMRLPVSVLETARLRELGRRLVHSVEATARQCHPGQTEAELAGEISHRLIKRRIQPTRIQVLGDGRGERFRHWTYGNEPIRSYATIVAAGSWHGLHLSVARTFSFDQPPQSLVDAHNSTALMLATGMAFSQDEWELCEVWKRVKRIYEKFDVPGEWQLARQAEVTGYNPSEVSLIPKSNFTLTAGMPICWHPSVGSALANESILITERGYEWLTPLESWPRLIVRVKGREIQCPGILVREAAGGIDQESEAEDSFLGHISEESGSEMDLSAILVE